MKTTKTLKHTVSILLMSLIAACSNASDSNSSARDMASVGQLCSDLNITSYYEATTAYSKRGANEYQITQNGCLLTVEDIKKNETWVIDLSGQSQVRVPDMSRRHNKSHLDLSTLRLKTKLAVVNKGTFENAAAKSPISVEGTIDIPKGPKNPFAVTVEIKAKLMLHTITNNNGLTQVEEISVSSANLRILQVSERSFTGIAANAFIDGANYILGFVNKMNLAPALFPDLNLYTLR